MSESLSWMQTGDTLALSGELDQDVLLPLWEMREEAVKGITCIDLSRVSRVDTGGLALLLHLIDLAKKQGNNVTLQGLRLSSVSSKSSSSVMVTRCICVKPFLWCDGARGMRVIPRFVAHVRRQRKRLISLPPPGFRRFVRCP